MPALSTWVLICDACGATFYPPVSGLLIDPVPSLADLIERERADAERKRDAAETLQEKAVALVAELEAHIVELDISRSALSDEADAAIARAEGAELALVELRGVMRDDRIIRDEKIAKLEAAHDHVVIQFRKEHARAEKLEAERDEAVIDRCVAQKELRDAIARAEKAENDVALWMDATVSQSPAEAAKDMEDLEARAEKAERERDEANTRAWRANCEMDVIRRDANLLASGLRVERDNARARGGAGLHEIIDSQERDLRDLRAKLERAEAAAAQMRAVLEVGASGCEEDGPDHHDFDAMVHAALATDVGAGYVSPEAHARAVAEARRQALDEAAKVLCWRCRGGAALTGPGRDHHDRDFEDAEPVPCAARAVLALLEKP